MLYNLLGVPAVQIRRLPQASEAMRDLDGTFGRDYFDGDRHSGYGGYYDDGRWAEVARRLRDHYNLTGGSRVLELGCAKGFLLKELALSIPGITVRGFEVSQYAKDHAPDLVKDQIDIGYPTRLPYVDDAFDLVLVINALHFMPEQDVRLTISEMVRIVRHRAHAFIQVDAYTNDLQYRSMRAWAPIVKCLLTPKHWESLFVNNKISVDTFYTVIEVEDLRSGLSGQPVSSH